MFSLIFNLSNTKAQIVLSSLLITPPGPPICWHHLHSPSPLAWSSPRPLSSLTNSLNPNVGQGTRDEYISFDLRFSGPGSLLFPACKTLAAQKGRRKLFSVLAMRQDLSGSEREELQVSLDAKLLPSFKKILFLSFLSTVHFFRAGQSLTR